VIRTLKNQLAMAAGKHCDLKLCGQSVKTHRQRRREQTQPASQFRRQNKLKRGPRFYFLLRVGSGRKTQFAIHWRL